MGSVKGEEEPTKKENKKKKKKKKKNQGNDQIWRMLWQQCRNIYVRYINMI